jgi:hypothetical protein
MSFAMALRADNPRRGRRSARAHGFGWALWIARGLCLAVLGALALPSGAAAVIHPTQVLQGPANNIIGVDGVAMAPDGSGGLLYSAHVNGVTHLFAIPFANGHWGSPTEVDGEDAYGASQPTIAAGEGGRLLVVWVQPRNVSATGVTLYELASASLQPGAGTFGQTIIVDPSVGEPYTGDVSGVEPRLAMAPDGTAYVVYRAVADDCNGEDASNPRQAECPAGPGELVEVRVARFEYLLWSSLGPVNRALQIPMRKPTPVNAPSIGIGVEGNGVVAWQEPEVSGAARIWVRRLFGTVQGNVLQASPETVGGLPVTSDAEDPRVAVGRFGEAKIAYRIDGGAGSAITTTQLYLNSLPSTFDPHGGQLEGPHPIQGAAAAEVGSLSDAVDPSGDFRLFWDQAGSVREVTGSPRGIGTPATVGSSTGVVQTTINPVGGGTAAWSSTANGSPTVAVREDYSKGAYQTAQLAGNLAGPQSGLSFAGSGEGDGLIGWMQGPPGDSEVVGGFVQAPPSSLIVSTSSSWVRSKDATVTWEPVTDAVAPVTYSIYVDGHVFESGLTGIQAALSSAQLGNGVHEVQVLAIDSAGQRTMSAKTKLKVDAEPPIVKIVLIDGDRGVRVTVRDGGPGVDTRATRISFGDGSQAGGRALVVHRYAHAGEYTITALVRSREGNQATVQLRVKVK